MVSVDPAWNILTCSSRQNMDEEMSKLLAVKIIQTYTGGDTVNEDAVNPRRLSR